MKFKNLLILFFSIFCANLLVGLSNCVTYNTSLYKNLNVSANPSINSTICYNYDIFMPFIKDIKELSLNVSNYNSLSTLDLIDENNISASIKWRGLVDLGWQKTYTINSHIEKTDRIDLYIAEIGGIGIIDFFSTLDFIYNYNNSIYGIRLKAKFYSDETEIKLYLINGTYNNLIYFGNVIRSVYERADVRYFNSSNIFMLSLKLNENNITASYNITDKNGIVQSNLTTFNILLSDNFLIQFIKRYYPDLMEISASFLGIDITSDNEINRPVIIEHTLDIYIDFDEISTNLYFPNYYMNKKIVNLTITSNFWNFTMNNENFPKQESYNITINIYKNNVKVVTLKGTNELTYNNNMFIIQSSSDTKIKIQFNYTGTIEPESFGVYFRVYFYFNLIEDFATNLLKNTLNTIFKISTNILVLFVIPFVLYKYFGSQGIIIGLIFAVVLFTITNYLEPGHGLVLGIIAFLITYIYYKNKKKEEVIGV